MMLIHNLSRPSVHGYSEDRGLRDGARRARNSNRIVTCGGAPASRVANAS